MHGTALRHLTVICLTLFGKDFSLCYNSGDSFRCGRGVLQLASFIAPYDSATSLVLRWLAWNVSLQDETNWKLVQVAGQPRRLELLKYIWNASASHFGVADSAPRYEPAPPKACYVRPISADDLRLTANS
jgi:hypothetical protein